MNGKLSPISEEGFTMSGIVTHCVMCSSDYSTGNIMLNRELTMNHGRFTPRELTKEIISSLRSFDGLCPKCLKSLKDKNAIVIFSVKNKVSIENARKLDFADAILQGDAMAIRLDSLIGLSLNKANRERYYGFLNEEDYKNLKNTFDKGE